MIAIEVPQEHLTRQIISQASTEDLAFLPIRQNCTRSLLFCLRFSIFASARDTDPATSLSCAICVKIANMTSPADNKPGVYANSAAVKQNMTSGGNLAFHNFNNDFAHISNTNERRRLALAEIDKAPFGWYHVRAIAVAGVSDCVGADGDFRVQRAPS